MKPRVALIVDNMSVSAWQQDALERLDDIVDIDLVLNCENTTSKRRLFKHAAYYALNLVSIRSALTRKRRIAAARMREVTFSAIHAGNWQQIPDAVVAELRREQITLVIKFGMSLLQMDNLEGIDVLSFHHGDPRSYRGRPAGFYEIVHRAPSVGMVVQRLSNRLDAGAVLAIGHSKLYPHSYRATIQTLYRNSPALLRIAVLNLIAGRTVELEAKGKNYRLPGNLAVVRFCADLLVEKLARLFYGALIEKKWNVAVQEDVSLPGGTLKSIAHSHVARVLARYSFYADPFFSSDGSLVRVEALGNRTGRGDILELDCATLEWKRTLLSGPHHSYPSTVVHQGQEFVLPEVASHSLPYLLDVARDGARIPLRGLESRKLIDPTIAFHDGTYFLFAGEPYYETTMLNLFVADDLYGPYTEHPMNPIVIDPARARMAGNLADVGGELFRFGQNNAREYGNGVAMMKVLKLTRTEYLEKEVARLRFPDAKGPHTINIHRSLLVLDFYTEKLSLAAGYRRLAGRISALISSRMSGYGANVAAGE